MPLLDRVRQDRKGIALKPARWMLVLALASFTFAWVAADVVDSRPRHSKSRWSKGTKAKSSKADRARRPSREEAALPPDPAPEDMPPLPERRVAPPPTEWPRSAVPLGPEPPPDTWPEDQVREALAQCHRLLGDVRFEFKDLPPLRKGSCGTPAPI